MLRQLLSTFQRVRVVFLTLVYAAIAVVSLQLAYLVRFDFNLPDEVQHERFRVLWLLIPVKLLALLFARQMGSLVTFFGISDFIRLSLALMASAVLLIIPRFTAYGQFSPPRGVLLVDFLVCLATFCSFRLAARLFRERVLLGQKFRGRRLEKVVIIGAGDTGASLVSRLINMPARGFRPVAFLDDDVNKHRQFIHGIEVVGATEEFASLACLEGIRRAIIAMPSASAKRIAEIALFLGRLGVHVETVPALEDLASGRAKIIRTRPVEVEDLLGREPVELDTASIRQFIENKVVMVTGAGGSIGNELSRQIARLNPRRLLMVDQSEPALFLIEQELNGAGFSGTATALVGDVLDIERMNTLFSVYAPQIVFHAAAHKHVYMLERQPSEAIKNNSVGTRKIAEIAVKHGAEAFVLISTDKAVNPTNVMGASKRLAELHLQALHTNRPYLVDQPSRPAEVPVNVQIGRSQPGIEASAPKLERSNVTEPEDKSVSTGPASTLHHQQNHAGTKLMAVRFGNVLGSSGSVVPIFKKQIDAGGPVTVTHPDVTRYFMTIPEAVGLVLQASVMGDGGEIFVLDMGQPMKIADLAKQMIELSGLTLGEDIEITFTGLKPGEKLFEELQHHSEHHVPTSHPRVKRFVSGTNPTEASRMAIQEIEPFVDEMSSNDLKRSLKVIIPEYDPCLE